MTCSFKLVPTTAALLLLSGGLWAADAPGVVGPPAPKMPAATGGDSAAVKPKLVTNLYSDSDLRQALTDVATQTGVSIVADSSVQGTVSGEFTDAPLDTVLEYLLLSGGFVYKEIRPGFFLVTSPDPKSPNYDQVVESRLVPLEFIPAAELKPLIPIIYQQYMQLDEALNQVMVTAPMPRLQRILDVIKAADVPPLQVMIEALVVETNASDLADFKASTQRTKFGVDNSTGLMTYVEQATSLLTQVQWLITNSRGTIKASPRVVAQHGHKASVGVSVQQYFQILSGQAGFGYYQLQAIEATVSVEIKPLVARSTKEITCDIKPVIGDVTGTGPNNLPIITKREASTTVRVRDGQVIALGGLLQHTETEIRRKIPILGDLPLLGQLFRSKSKSLQDREVTIFIVPHILDADGQFAGPLVLERFRQESAAQAAVKPTVGVAPPIVQPTSKNNPGLPH